MRVLQIRYYVFLLICLLLSSGGCALKKPNLPPPLQAGSVEAPNVLIESYKMAVADQLRIYVWKNSELSISEAIRPDGRISVPLVGDVMAVGLTPEELSEILEEELSSYIKNPNVTVILTGITGGKYLSRIRVTGSVGRNTAIDYKQGMTVMDAVLEAGSADMYADSNNTKLHRRSNNGTDTYDIRLKDIMNNGDMTTNVTLMPGDIITVPERSF